MTDVILCGVGGQGTVLASKTLAAAAMAKGLDVMSAETIGMAQKGGSVYSHLRIGRGLKTPLIAKGSADAIIAFEPAEAVRALPFLKNGGKVVVNTHAVEPVTSILGKDGYDGQAMIDYLERNVGDLDVIDCDAVCEKIGSPRITNMILLGAAVRSGVLALSLDDVKEAMRGLVKPQFHEMNEAALDYDGC